MKSEHFKKTRSKPTVSEVTTNPFCHTPLMETKTSLLRSKQGERGTKIPPLDGKTVKVTLQKSMGDGRYYCIHL